MRTIYLSFLLLIQAVIFASPPFFMTFTPPKGWVIADLAQMQGEIKVGFIKSTKGFFSPAITLSFERVEDGNFLTYLSAVKQHYASDPTNYCRMLGTLNTSLGETALLQIDVKHQCGKIGVFQAISFCENYAIIQTATCLQKDLLAMREIFLDSFKSIVIYPTLLASFDNLYFQRKVQDLYNQWEQHIAASNIDSETLFKNPSFQNNQWIPFVHFIEKECAMQGSCWQFLALQYVKESLLQR